MSASDGAWRYVIRLKCHLDLHWSECLGGMTITHEEGGETRLEGVLVDQATLAGLLNRLCGMNLPVLSVQRLDAAAPQTGGAGEGSEGDE